MNSRCGAITPAPDLRAWDVDTTGFPTGGSVQDALAFCVRYAVLAPSTHNAQPWWFALDAESVVVGLDPSRGLAVVDPDDREATISVGAAIHHLRTALAHFGFASSIDYWPDPHDPAACARITAVDQGVSDPTYAPLFGAITRRHTNRGPFRDQPLPPMLVETLARDALAEGAQLTTVTDYPGRRRIAELVSRADLAQMGDKRFRRELATWMRPANGRHCDGIVGYDDHLGAIMSVAAPLLVRTFDVGSGRAARDVELATGSPVLGVLSTGDDDRTSWLRAGQALSRVLLRATATHLQAGFLDQPVEVDELREQLAAALGIDGIPQVLLRLGYGSPATPQPRRPLHDVFLHD